MNNSNFVSKLFTNQNTFHFGVEGPACDREGNLYAVNYARKHTIGKVTPKGECSLFLDLPEGSTGNGIRFNRSGDMFIADYTGHNVLRVDMETKHVSVFAHEPSMNQPNDLAITAQGVLYASDPNWKQKTGQLWRIDLDGSVTLLETGMGTTNGIEVSPDGRKLYVNETVQRKIWVYDLTPTFEIMNKELFIEFPDFGLDGMRCDISGNVYVTRYGKGTVVKLSPNGDVLTEISLLGEKCTNLTFGGPVGKTCYVTVSESGSIETFQTDLPGRCWALWNDKTL